MNRLHNLLVWIGGIAMLAATATDCVAVVGRHVGLPLRGSIELMQALVLIIGAASVAVATLVSYHARVRLLIDRIAPAARTVADRFSDAATALFFAALLAGSVWLAIDLWNGHEVSETAGVPWRLMRLFANLCLAVCLAIVFRRALWGRKP
jgi:TRAP-type C4-dicarboxylate transport system permease small subunit